MTQHLSKGIRSCKKSTDDGKDLVQGIHTVKVRRRLLEHRQPKSNNGSNTSPMSESLSWHDTLVPDYSEQCLTC